MINCGDPYSFFNCLYCDIPTLNDDMICDRCAVRYNCCFVCYFVNYLMRYF